MSQPLTVQCVMHFERAARGRKQVEAGPAAPQPVLPAGRVPRVARLMALAIRFDRLLREGAVASSSELARLGHVTAARVSQVLSLVYLAPDIQEALLFLQLTERGRDKVVLRDVLLIAAELDWRKQRRLWQQRMHLLFHKPLKFIVTAQSAMRSLGAGCPARWAAIASWRYVSAALPCNRSVCTTVSIRSAKRQPSEL